MNLDPVRTALAAIPDRDLRALSAAADTARGPLEGLIAWLEHAASWEIDRRAHRDYALCEPLEALDESDVPESVVTLATLALHFNRDAHDEIAAFLTAAADCLRREARMH